MIMRVLQKKKTISKYLQYLDKFAKNEITIQNAGTSCCSIPWPGNSNKFVRVLRTLQQRVQCSLLNFFEETKFTLNSLTKTRWKM